MTTRSYARAAIRSLRVIVKTAERPVAGRSSTARDWLRDNRYLAERECSAAILEIRGIRLPPAYLSRVAESAAACLDYCGGNVTESVMESYLSSCSPLREAELTAFIPALRIAITEKLASLCPELGADDGGVLAERFSALFTSLRRLATFDASEMLERVNAVEQTLRRDPAGVYALMDEETRRDYRRENARLAKKHRVSEFAAAERVVELSERSGGHVGEFIFTTPFGRAGKPRTGRIYISVILALTFLISFAAAYGGPWGLFPLVLIPASEIAARLIDFIVRKTARTQRLPRLALKDGIPVKCAAVVSVLLSSPKAAEHAANLLEEYRLSNRDAGGNLLFGLLADLPESKSERDVTDEPIIKAAREAICRLNAVYGGGFYLFLRGRTYRERDGIWSGRERKRGAIEDLAKLLSGRQSDMRVMEGDEKRVYGAKFILTLDADTRLTAGSAVELVGAMLHPLNTPRVCEETRIVRSGYGILQPRVVTELGDAVHSELSRVFCGGGGLDPYGVAAREVYPALTGSGSFIGKGIIDVESYLRVLDGRFPKNRVLSHDLLEGAYLRCGFLGDVELTDGHPTSPAPYYARAHRWVRGDWQNARWLFVRDGLPALDKWKILDNLRRSLLPIAAAACLIAAAFDRAFFIAAGIAALSLAFGDILRFFDAIFHFRGRMRRYFSFVPDKKGTPLARCFARLLLLPADASVCLRAVAVSLWRCVISRRRLLEWTTAADAEKKRGGLFSYIRLSSPAVFASLAVIFFSPFPPAAALGIIWALSPLYMYALDLYARRVRRTPVPPSELMAYAADIWRFFDTFLTESDNYLPPDNFQESPGGVLARRTSPTNIGLSLLSCAAAVDLGLTSLERAMFLIENTLATVEKLEKWNGHLYNWYDTATLEPLPPRYVSAVDSGNLAASIIALREALVEFGRHDLAERAAAICRDMDFAPLYDTRRRLFLIGYDADSGEYSESAYDLMASEAMQTSYFAIARGDVPRKHWRTLSRAQVGLGGYRGMASWTGTMFEYLMPYLLLPLPEHSLLYESARFCVYAQRRAVYRGVWGMSESAYNAFSGGVYRYKAHGLQSLALRRGMNADAVIAPYASFLALCVDLGGAAKNLRRLKSLGASGKYGFYEAVDFTPERSGGGEIVKTYMAHHLGMSLVALCNCLRSGIMRDRFTRDAGMRAHLELLRESVPRGGAVISARGRAYREIPENRSANRPDGVEIRDINVFAPPCAALSDDNGTWRILISASGQSESRYRGVTLTRCEFDANGRHSGTLFFLKIGRELIPLQPAPFLDSGVEYSAFIGGGGLRIRSRRPGLRASVTVRTAEDGSGEIRAVELSSSTAVNAELLCYFEPVLKNAADYLSHPAFSKLSLTTKRHGDALVVTRRPRGNEKSLSLALAADADAVYHTSRERVLGRRGFSALGDDVQHADNIVSAALDPCVLARVKVKLAPGAAARVNFALAADADIDAAVNSANALLIQKKPSRPNSGDNCLFAELLSLLLYRSPSRRIDGERISHLSQGRGGLWSLGISGDYPIVTADLDACGSTLPRELLNAHARLCSRGTAFDLVFLTNEGGDDYIAPHRETVASLLRESGRESAFGARGGVFIVEKSSPGVQLVLSLAKRSFPSAVEETPPRRRPPEPMTRVKPGGDPPHGWNPDGSFWFDTTGDMPPGAWSHVLANPGFGALVTDACTGYIWRGNARENKINGWMNDALTTVGTERAHITNIGKSEMHLSLFAAPDGFPCRVTYGFGFAVWEKTVGADQSGGVTVKTTAFVPPGSNARVLLIETSAPAELTYCLDLEFSDGTGDGTTVVTERRGNAIYASNPFNTDFDTSFALCLSEPISAFTCSRASYLADDFDGVTGAGFPSCAAVKVKIKNTLVIAAGSPDDAQVLADITRARAAFEETKAYWTDITGKIRLKSEYETLDRYINGWALYQTLACRVYARTSLYQCGGAFGFRDQLQDVCALAHTMPQIAREHILRAAAHQFEEGDVQHWWHETERGARGVRTRCSDDLLWLPEAVCEYIKLTGDDGILDEEIPFLRSPELDEDEDERYEEPQISGESANIYEHCRRAIERVITRGAGEHRLCLMGGGDWNDGMNLVGAKGRGESVWLTWFFVRAARRFAEITRRRGDADGAERLCRAADEYSAAANAAWDGQWFLRGWFDDGSPLGSADSAECKIDSIAQSFAVLGGGDPDKTKTALKSAVNLLYDRETSIVKLFKPPFTDGGGDQPRGANPGYIRGYAPGFRENGAQYTHGAVWLALGLLLADMPDDGWDVLSAILPSGRGAETYRTEPYVLPADVYANEAHLGRGGWTWYTGAAGWYLRTVVEGLLGVDVNNGEVTCSPRTPDGWGDFTLTLERPDGVWTVRREGANVTVTRE